PAGRVTIACGSSRHSCGSGPGRTCTTLVEGQPSAITSVSKVISSTPSRTLSSTSRSKPSRARSSGLSVHSACSQGERRPAAAPPAPGPGPVSLRGAPPPHASSIAVTISRAAWARARLIALLLPEDRFALAQRAIDHALNGGLHHPNLLVDRGVLVVRV